MVPEAASGKVVDHLRLRRLHYCCGCAVLYERRPEAAHARARRLPLTVSVWKIMTI